MKRFWWWNWYRMRQELIDTNLWIYFLLSLLIIPVIRHYLGIIYIPLPGLIILLPLSGVGLLFIVLFLIETIPQVGNLWRYYVDFKRVKDMKEMMAGDLRGINLVDTILWNVDLSNIDLEGANLSRADLCKADLSGANLQDTNLTKTSLWSANMEQADLGGSTMCGADLVGVNLSEANLYSAKLSKAHLWKANLSGADLRDTNLSGARIWEANLSGADLAGANLREAEMRDANLSGACLVGANLSGADLRLATLSDANLSGADLREANMSGADMKFSDLPRGVLVTHGAWRRMVRANLCGANLRDTQNITPEQLSQAILDENTTMTDGSKYKPPDKQQEEDE